MYYFQLHISNGFNSRRKKPFEWAFYEKKIPKTWIHLILQYIIELKVVTNVQPRESKLSTEDNAQAHKSSSNFYCKLRDLIAKMGENSPPRFWPDFLFMSLTYATYLGVLENI